MSTFWNCSRKPSKRKVFTCYLVVARLGLIWGVSRLTSSSLVDIACHMTSLYLCWKTFLKTRLISKSLGKGEHRLFAASQPWSIIHDHFPTPWQYPPGTPNHTRAMAVPSKYSVRTNSIFLKTFYKTKTRHMLSMAIPTVHDRGLGYSNRLHSAEVVHFTHKIR
jgi:hypothetical protein